MKRLAVLFAIALLACTPTTPDGRGQSPSGTAGTRCSAERFLAAGDGDRWSPSRRSRPAQTI